MNRTEGQKGRRAGDLCATLLFSGFPPCNLKRVIRNEAEKGRKALKPGSVKPV
jgi:hypothetical protein